jgi:hypothetical protein
MPRQVRISLLVGEGNLASLKVKLLEDDSSMLDAVYFGEKEMNETLKTERRE